MAVKMALAVGLFIVICGPPGLTASQIVPDGLVYTEVKKTLVQGVQGVLTCRFYGKPFEVYWKKGLTPEDLSPMVVWKDGELTGPRYDDGSCDVDENYSLIINNVSMADAGRIYCIVNNYKGPLMKNYTDMLVVDTAITTNTQVTLQMRQAIDGILQCTVHIKARKVSWKKGTTSSANESLVVMESNKNVSERSGNGYDDGKYNITQDYSLVIKELQLHHEGLYVCEVTDDTGISFRNHTFVNMVAQPLEPFPTIQECLNADQHDSNYCILVAKSGMTLTCQVVKYYPSINLVFLYGSKVLQPSDTREWDNTNGTKNKTVTIAVRGNKELYSCVASSVPGTNVNKSTSVLLQGDEPVKSALVISLVLFAALILISSLAYFIWKKKHFDQYTITRSASHLELEEAKALIQYVSPLELCVNDVLIKHYRKFHEFFQTESAIQAEQIISENRTALFDTQQMLLDWRESRTTTGNKENIDLIEHEPDVSWPCDEELKTISHHLTQESMKKVCKKLKVSCRQNNDANDEGKRLKTLRIWKTKAKNQSLEETYWQLAPVLESNNFGGLLPTLRGPYTYNAELVDLAFHLLMQDLFPFAKALGISVTKLASYRPAFDPSHLKMGTIKLLIDLSAYSGDERSGAKFEGGDYFVYICSEIAKHHYRNAYISKVFMYDMSYGELCSISEAIHKDAQGRAEQDAGPEIEVVEEFGNLQDVLQLTDQETADRLDTSHQLTAYALFKIWKEKPRPSVFNYRAALAHDVRRTGMPDLADKIIAGKYITEQTSLTFIENMVQGLKPNKIRSLGELLQLSVDEEQWHTRTPFDEIIQQIYDWVADWTTGLKVPPMKATAEQHRDLNDTLIEHGLLDLAREIMIIEQQISCKYWLDNNIDDSDVNIKQ